MNAEDVRGKIDQLRDGYWLESPDFNNDGKPDLIGYGLAMGEIYWYENGPQWKRHLITGGMAVRVVVRLEMIDVEHGDAVAVLVTGHAGLEEFEILFEGPAVTQSGERVPAGEGCQLVVQAPKLLGVDEEVREDRHLGSKLRGSDRGEQGPGDGRGLELGDLREAALLERPREAPEQLTAVEVAAGVAEDLADVEGEGAVEVAVDGNFASRSRTRARCSVKEMRRGLSPARASTSKATPAKLAMGRASKAPASSGSTASRTPATASRLRQTNRIRDGATSCARRR